MSRRSIVVIVVLCSLATVAWMTGWFEPHTTPAEIHSLLRRETPIGSTSQRVEAFLDSAGVEHGAYDPHERQLPAIWRRTSVGLVSELSIEVQFFFTEENRLNRYEVKEVILSQ